MNVGFKLKKNSSGRQVLLIGIMHAAAWFPHFRARKSTARFKIHMDIELPSFNAKIHDVNVPWIFEIQCYLKEGFM